MLVIVLLINKNAKLYYCKYLLMIPRNSVNYRQGEFELYRVSQQAWNRPKTMFWSPIFKKFLKTVSIHHFFQVEMKGLTGTIKFDQHGLRTDFTLEVVELKKDGLVKVIFATRETTTFVFRCWKMQRVKKFWALLLQNFGTTFLKIWQ